MYAGIEEFKVYLAVRTKQNYVGNNFPAYWEGPARERERHWQSVFVFLLLLNPFSLFSTLF